MSEEYDLKKNDYRVSVEVTEFFKNRIETLELKIQEMEGTQGEQASQIAKLQSEKLDILYAAKNALKKAFKHRHYLRQAFEKIDEDTANEIRDMLREVGVKIDY